MNSRSLLTLVAVFSSIFLWPSGARAELGRFIQVVKNETPDTRFHLGELEAFQIGTTPDELGVAGSGLTTSTNDIGDGSLVTYGDGNLLPAIGTTSALEHGGANKNPNNQLENVGNVWSTANAQATNAQYTLDLGGTFDVTTVRMWPRNDTCCNNRWQNLEVNIYADDGTGAPGALVASSDDARLTAPGGNVALELTFFPGSTAIENIAFTPAFSYPEEGDAAILSSASAGTAIGSFTALNEFGSPVPSAVFSLVSGDGDTNNGSWEFDGGPDLELTGDLTGVDGPHSVRVQATTDEGSVAAAFPFTVLADTDNDGLVDSWELMFGALGDFTTGGDSDGDGQLDEEEFRDGTDPSLPDDALYIQRFIGQNGGYIEAATGNSPIPSVYNSARSTWSMAGDPSGPATNTLDSPAITVPVTGGIQISFDHRYSIEPEWDGTALQISVDGGPFETVPTTSFSQNGYTFSGLIGNHVLAGQDGFNGDSEGYAAGDFITSIADLGGIAMGSTITLRFLGAWDDLTVGLGNPNWEIDSVRLDFLPDQDGDGMPDAYEIANGLDETMDDAGDDADSDTVSNLDEYLARTDPNDDDSDDDGLLDGVETNTGTFVDAGDTGTNPLVADTDGDGLGDMVEDNTGTYAGPSNTGTDPNVADSDGDGFNDGYEVSQGTDPTDSADTPPLPPSLAWFAEELPDGFLTTWEPSLNLTTNAGVNFTGGNGGTVQSGASNFGAINAWVNSPGYNFNGNPNDSWHDGLGDPATKENVSWEFVFRPGDYVGKHTLFNTGGNGSGLGFTLTGSVIEFVFQSANSDDRRVRVSSDLALLGPATDFYHVVGVADVDTASTGTGLLYVNGILADGPTTSTGAMEDWDGGDLAELGKGNNIPGGNPFNPDAFTGDIAVFSYYAAELLGAPSVEDKFTAFAGARIPFAIISILHDPASGTTTIEWNSRSNGLYAVDASPDLQNWEELDDGIESKGDTTTFSTSLPLGTPRQHYRVRELD